MLQVGQLAALVLAAFPVQVEGQGLMLPRLRLDPPVLLALADATQGQGGQERSEEERREEWPGPGQADAGGKGETPRQEPGGEAAPPGPSLDFDLLGAPSQPAAPPVDEAAVGTRRGMLKVHQALGIGLLALDLTTVVLGQLNYRDRFGGGDRSGRFRRAHAAFAYTTFGLFVTNELIALLAPTPIQKESQGFDRVMLHRIGMFTAAALMVAEVVLGIYTAERTGHLSQRDVAKVHLFLGYGTFAAMAVGASAFVF